MIDSDRSRKAVRSRHERIGEQNREIASFLIKGSYEHEDQGACATSVDEGIQGSRGLIFQNRNVSITHEATPGKFRLWEFRQHNGTRNRGGADRSDPFAEQL